MKMISEGRVMKIMHLIQAAETALGHATDEEDEVEHEELVLHAHSLIQQAVQQSFLLDQPVYDDDIPKEFGK
jgi:hypothetical protein